MGVILPKERSASSSQEVDQGRPSREKALLSAGVGVHVPLNPMASLVGTDYGAGVNLLVSTARPCNGRVKS